MKTLLLAGFISLAATLAPAATLYVDAASTNAVPPFTNWLTAAAVIQDAVDASVAGDEIVVVDGVYTTGGRPVGTNLLVNRVAVEKPVTLRSVNGPEVTVILGYQLPGGKNGDGAIRCVYLADGAMLSGFTLTNGATLVITNLPQPENWLREQSGGGVWCASTNVLVTNCTIVGNRARSGGGGVHSGTLTRCRLLGNSAQSGGGADNSLLINCMLTGNMADGGGGANQGELRNCTLVGNSANFSGGGIYGSQLINCTLVSNSASISGGGASSDYPLSNCILYYNTAPSEANYVPNSYGYGYINYCCTTPYPSGASNITSEPLFVDRLNGNLRLQSTSPCRDSGNNAYVSSSTDLDGTERIVGGTVDMGAYEFHAPPATHYVWQDSPSPGSPYNDWTNAAHTIQEAVLAAGPGDTVLVTNGLYATGGFAVNVTTSNRVAVTKALQVRSVMGPEFTVIRGYQLSGITNGEGAMRCVYLTDGAVLDGFTLTNGATRDPSDPAKFPRDGSGGGVWCLSTNALVTNCILVGNSAVHHGGGAFSGTLNNCTLTGNKANAGGGTCSNTLNGCTISGNYSSGDHGGGARASVLNNCTLTGNSSAYGGGGAVFATLNNCTLLRNSAAYGGGAYGSTLSNCTLSNNLAYTEMVGDLGGPLNIGGGTAFCRLSNCTLSNNRAESCGGGAYQSTLTNCTLIRNSAYDSGGGAYSTTDYSAFGTMYNCTLSGNFASTNGGGVYGGTLNNCALNGNSANNNGGGACYCMLSNCTVTGNSAYNFGGGVYDGTLNNCIVYYNRGWGGMNSYICTFNYCCTTPMWNPDSGNNITNEPALASASHISSVSPCRGMGQAASASGVDIDGDAWLDHPSIGCDEYIDAAVTGAVTVAIGAAWTNVAPGIAVDWTALISGRVSSSVWDFGDGNLLSNRPYASHSWATAGDYAVVLRAYNDSNPGGVSATVTVWVVVPPLHYVAVGSTNPVAPYTNWATAAQTIQDAVDAASVPGALILVSNGIYATGGRAVHPLMTNRVAVYKPLEVRSVNGPQVTTIQGYQLWPPTYHGCGAGAIRCVYLTNGAVLNGFTLKKGATRIVDMYFVSREHDGGGMWCEGPGALVSNCILTGNSAYGQGGGVTGGTLNNCIVKGNWASEVGGAVGGILNNCTITGNSTDMNSAGVFRATLNNCILQYNIGPNYVSFGETLLNYCCTAPMPTNGTGNITNEPAFVDLAGSNFRLQSNSPCINSGNNAYAAGSTDLDGRPRIVGGTVDMGAYEYQGPGMSEFLGWLAQFSLPTDGTADFTDPDGDGLNNWQEWRCGTDPNDALSALLLLPPAPVGADVTLTWQSVTNRNYFLEWSTDLSATPAFLPLATNLPGQPGTTTFTHTNGAGLGPCFFRVAVP